MMLTAAMSVLAGVAFSAPSADALWELVECTDVAGPRGPVPWCRATGSLAAPLDRVGAALEQMARHQDVFDAVRSIQMVAPDTAHVVLDFPGLLADRDYVARYTAITEGSTRRYVWEPVQHPDVPPQPGIVRLERMAGEWRLEAVDTHTAVTYLWEAELQGSFPEWALPIARKRAGFEALKDLSTSLGSPLVAR